MDDHRCEFVAVERRADLCVVVLSGTDAADSSIGPIVNMVRTREGAYTVEGFGEDASDHVQLDFSTGSRSGFGIWSIRFSADAREIVAGASSGSVFAYDVERRCTTLRVNAHDDDVNAVAFADEASSNVLVSGSDDSFIKVRSAT